MEVKTNTREMAERSSKLAIDLESALTKARDEYALSTRDVNKLAEDEVQKYHSFVNNKFDEAKKSVLNGDFSALHNLEVILEEKTNEHEKNKGEADLWNRDYTLKYNSAVEDTMTFYFSQVISFTNKRIKDYLEYREGNGINWKKVEEAREGLKLINSKKMRKQRKKNELLRIDHERIEKEYTNIINTAEKKKREFGSMSTNPIDMPVWVKTMPTSSGNMEVGIYIPVIKEKEDSFQKKISVVIFDELYKITKEPRTKESPFVNYSFTAGNEDIRKLEENIETRLGDILKEANIKIKVYNTPLKNIPEIKKTEYSQKETPKLQETVKEQAEKKTEIKAEPEKKASLEKAVSVAERKGFSKSRLRNYLVDKGAEYVLDYFKSKGDMPSVYSWNCENVTIDDMKRAGWKNFAQYKKSLVKSRKGKDMRKKIEKNYVERGYREKDIARRLKIAPTAVNYDLQEQGLMTDKTIKMYYDSLDKIKAKKIRKFKNYSKDSLREMMINESAKHLSNNAVINYLGLEGPNFGSYISISEKFKVNPEKSVVAEKDSRACNAMECIARNHKKIKGGKIFNGLNLYRGDVSDFVKNSKDYSFNFINLDYNGSLSYKELRTIDDLFENNLVANDAVMYLTINNSPRKKLQNDSAFLEDYGTSDYKTITTKNLNDVALNHGYKIGIIDAKEYRSGRTPMSILGFKLKK